MLTLIGKQDRTDLIDYSSIDIQQTAGDPLSKAHFQLIDPSASIALPLLSEVIFIDETVQLQRIVGQSSGPVASPWSDAFNTKFVPRVFGGTLIIGKNQLSYTTTSAAGGSVASWNYAGNTLTAIGGISALYLLNSWSAQSPSINATMTASDNGGLACNVVDSSDYYELAVGDASSLAAPNTLHLYKTVSGVRSAIGSASIAFTRGTSHTIGLAVINNGSSNAITATFDGVATLTQTDTLPLGTGQVGLRNDTGTAVFTTFSATSNDGGVAVTDAAVPAHNYLANNNFNFGSGAWTEGGALTGRITFPPSGTFGAAAIATLTFANQAIGSDMRSQDTPNTGSSANNYVVPGQEYCFSATVNVASSFTGSYAFLQIIFFDVVGTTLSTTTSSPITASSGPQRFFVTATAPANAWNVRAVFGGTTTTITNSGTATFTALQLEPMWFPSRYSYPSPICDFLQSDSVIAPLATITRFDRIFTGFITDLKVSYIGATRIYDVEATSADWSMENATLVNATYLGATDQTIITNIASSLAPHLYASTPSLAAGTPQALAYRNVPVVYAGVTIAGMQYADNTLREVMNSMNTITGFLFGVDPYYNLFYFPPFYNISPYGFSSSPDNVTTFSYYDYSIEYDASQLQNALNVVGTTFPTTITESWHLQDGSHTETVQGGKTVDVTLFHTPNAVPTVVVGGTGISCGWDNGTGYGGAQSIVSSPQFGIPNLLSFPSPGYAAGTSISVTYAYNTLAYIQAQSPDSIGEFGRTLYGKVNDSSLVSIAAAVTSGEATLQAYAQPRVTLNFKCQKLVQPSQVITFTSALDGIAAQHFTVHQVTARSLGAGINEYEIQAGTYLDDFVDFFRNTQKSLTRADHDPAAPLQSHNNLQQDALSISDSLNIHT